MGEVFAATDTQHGRSVAIKVVSEKMLADPELRRRFVHEAKTASSLQHPNVVSIFDVGKDADQHFIAMELVPGVTLDEKIGAKPLPLREALRYARQIADALQSAHALGIVHRDLKPGNVMVTGDGQVKLLDFGLAKRETPFTGSASAATEVLGATIAPMTEVGTIVGTVFYMSPEQAEGKPVDVRSDIFSFGAMLYEMLTGRKAFDADTKMAALTAIMHKEPAALTEVPPALGRLVERCLRKDPQRRAQSMADVRVELDDILAALEQPAAAVRPPAPTRRWMLPALAGAAVGAVPAFFAARQTATPRPIRFQRQTYRRGDIYSARFAPGGNIVYSAGWDGGEAGLYVTQPGVREARDLNQPNCRVAAVSSKGDLALIRGALRTNATGLLVRVPLGGGNPRDVLEDVGCADWAADGEQLAVGRVVAGKPRLDFPIGTPRWQGEGLPPTSVSLTADGSRMAFVLFDRVTGDYSVMVWENGGTRLLQAGYRAMSELCWSPSGREVMFTATHLGQEPSLFAVDLQGKERIAGQMAGNSQLQQVQGDGTVLVSHVNTQLHILGRVPSAPGGRELAWYEASMPYGITSDGQSIILAELSYGVGRNVAIFLRKTDASQAVRLGYGGRPALSPDGRYVACLNRLGSTASVNLLPTGAGEPRALLTNGFIVEGVEWVDNERLLAAARRGTEALRSWLCPVTGGEPRAVTPPGQRGLAPNAKGQLVLRTGKGFALRALDGGEAATIPGLTAADTIMRWSADGEHLLVRRVQPAGLEFARLQVASGKREVLHRIPLPEPGANFGPQAHISPDGQWWVCSYQHDLATLYTVTGMS